MQEKKLCYTASMHRATLIAAATSTVHLWTPLSSAEPSFDWEGGPSGPEVVGVGGASVGGAALPLNVCKAESGSANGDATPRTNHGFTFGLIFSFGIEQVTTPQSVTLGFQSAEAHIYAGSMFTLFVVFARAARLHPAIQSSCSSVRPLTASAEASRTFEARTRPKTISNTPRIGLS
ncbi:hypothetical protein C8J57DRAFT_1295227 [Mycena rebaudengoi]|nr:hypothetical protein C8J57DRAFT_1295227 [Mycena rebaudengoi]